MVSWGQEDTVSTALIKARIVAVGCAEWISLLSLKLFENGGSLLFSLNCYTFDKVSYRSKSDKSSQRSMKCLDLKIWK